MAATALRLAGYEIAWPGYPICTQATQTRLRDIVTVEKKKRTRDRDPDCTHRFRRRIPLRQKREFSEQTNVSKVTPTGLRMGRGSTEQRA